MNDLIGEAARAAAKRLAPAHDPQLAAEVEEALQARGTPASADQYLDPVSLGGLIVAIATLAWTVYNDRKGKEPRTSPEEITRTVKARLTQTTTLDLAQQQPIITVIVEETLHISEAERTDT